MSVSVKAKCKMMVGSENQIERKSERGRKRRRGRADHMERTLKGLWYARQQTKFSKQMQNIEARFIKYVFKEYIGDSNPLWM